MRKCWNCGEPTNDETSRVCSDKICQRAEKKSQLKHKEKFDAKKKKQREYMQRPERKAWTREYMQCPERKAKALARQQSPEYKAKARERYLRNKKLREEE